MGRKNLIIEKCLVFSNKGDYCEKCEEGFYADKEQGCKIFPQGI